MASPQFDSAKEFRTVMDQIFTMMSEDPEMGPALKDADTPQRFEFDDFDLVVNIRAGEAGEGNLHWEWSDDVDWKPKVKMTMSSETANKYFQGKENVAVAIARRRIKTGGDVKAALALIPITKPVYARYRDLALEARVPAPQSLTRPAFEAGVSERNTRTSKPDALAFDSGGFEEYTYDHLTKAIGREVRGKPLARRRL